MVGLEILVEIGPLKQLEFQQAFEMAKNDKSLNDARLDLALYKKVDEANVFIWIECWRDIESLEHYFSDHSYKVLLGAIRILGKLRDKRICVYMEDF